MSASKSENNNHNAADDEKKITYPSYSKQQLKPLVHVHIHSSNTQRPLLFGECILDALDCQNGHELSIDYQEQTPTNPSVKTQIIISQNTSDCNDIPVLNELIDKLENNNNDIDHPKQICTILGHSRYSPLRRLKQHILKEEGIDLSKTCCTHQQYVQQYLCKQLSVSGQQAVYPKLATVIIVMDSENNILLTRRHPQLRSFPNCFVVPGGSVDPGESMRCAAKREVWEEVGINIDLHEQQRMRMVAIWESVFPDSKANETVTESSIRYHHIVPIWMYQLQKKYTEYALKLCGIEVDCAVWIKADALQRVINAQWNDEMLKQTIQAMRPNGDAIEIKMQCLNGIYPNPMKQGIARGHLYGINKLFKSLNAQSNL